MADYILDTPVTITWLKQKFLEGSQRKTKVQLKSWSAEITGENKGFASFIIRVVFHWSVKDRTLPNSVVIKCPTGQKFKKLGEELMPEGSELFDAMDDFIPLIHRTECAFYRIWEKEPIPLKIPKCYFGQEIQPNQPGVLVFDDLCDVMAQQTIGHGMTVNQLTEVAENLAGLHAWSLTHDGWVEKFPPWKKEPFEKFSDTNKSMFEKLKKDMCPQHLDADMVDVVMKHGMSLDDFWYALSVHEEFKMPPVLVHGDLWVGNMMFKKQLGKDGQTSGPSDELLAIFDWQTAYPGCASADFLRMACTSIPAEIRREKLPSIMQHYYNTLRKKLGKEPPFTYDTLMKSYSRGFKAAFLAGFGVILIFLGRPEICGGPGYEKDMIYRAKCLLEDAVVNIHAEWDK